MFIKKRMDLPFFVFSSFFRLFFLVRTGSNPNQSSAWLARRGVAVLGKTPQIVMDLPFFVFFFFFFRFFYLVWTGPRP